MSETVGEVRIHKTPLAKELHEARISPLKRYWRKALGDVPLARFVQYEIATMLVGDLGGALGYLLRKAFYRPLFARMGGGVILGKGIALRHPARITLGDQVAIDDNVLLDASGPKGSKVDLGDQVIVSRNCVIQGKSGPLTIGARTDIGCNTIITSPAAGIEIGRAVLIAGNCYIGGSRYIADRLDIPMIDQGIYSKGPVIIEDGCWLGAGVTVLDGVRIGKGCIVGAGAVVTKDLPAHSVAVGTPAQVVRTRSSSVIEKEYHSETGKR
ncbi:MAG: acyltransferase [Caldilineaceae bacterium]|nr:acyltransferase [Caldilineaceae bacterium]